jgi:hypothetical protein
MDRMEFLLTSNAVDADDGWKFAFPSAVRYSDTRIYFLFRHAYASNPNMADTRRTMVDGSGTGA